jgi:putative transposase
MERIYDTDLTDSQWNLIRDLFPVQYLILGLVTRFYPWRRIVNAILYRTKSGVPYRLLPKEFPPWKSVHAWHLRFERSGVLDRILARLRWALRKETPYADKSPRASSPTLAIIDSQSVKSTAEAAAETCGFDGGKKVKGRKRHLVVDALGMLLCVWVTPANVHDTHGAREVLRQVHEKFSSVTIVMADAGYQGPLVEEMKRLYGIDVQIAHKTSKCRFEVLPVRWIVERSHAWVGRDRINAKECERTLDASRANVKVSFIRKILNRLNSS